MKISVIIAAYNAASTIAVQLEALYQQQYSAPFEIIVVNNGSTDSTADIIRQYQLKMPHLRLLEASACRTPGYARNVGAKAAQGEYLVFCDADDEVTPSWLAVMAQAFKQHDFVAGKSDYTKLNSSRWAKYLVDSEVNGVCRGFFLPFAGSNNLGIKRSLHEMIGGFDEALRSLQDIDYCWRAQEVGVTLNEIPDAIVNFRFRSSLKAVLQRMWRVGFYSVLLYRKHVPMGFPRWLLVKGVLAAGFAPVKFFLKVRDRRSFMKWLLHCAWCLGYLQGWFKLGFVKPAPIIPSNSLSLMESSAPARS